jgi:hypothetical protein
MFTVVVNGVLTPFDALPSLTVQVSVRVAFEP